MVRLIADLYARIRHLVPELAKFGVVGGTGAVIDLGGAAVLHSAYHQGPLKAKAISIAAATMVTYLGSRYWTFRHRENQPLLREGTLFVVLNLIGLAIAEVVIAFTTYVLVLKGPISYNLASLAGTGLGTIFRYFAYRKWVFLAPAAQPAPAAERGFAALPPWNAGPTPWNARPTAAPAYAAASPLAFAPHSAPVAAASPAWPGHESPWPQHQPPSAAQPPSWSRQPAAPPPSWSRPPAPQAPSRGRQPAAQATKAPPRSSGGRHRKPRSA
ncbi:MAG TPA: GtrA family protein [Trebonia sp.]